MVFKLMVESTGWDSNEHFLLQKTFFNTKNLLLIHHWRFRGKYFALVKLSETDSKLYCLGDKLHFQIHQNLFKGLMK